MLAVTSILPLVASYVVPRCAGYSVAAYMRRTASARVHAATDDEHWVAFSKFNAMVAWTGTATVINPLTAEPSQQVAYEHFVASVPGAPRIIKTTTTTASGTRSEETVNLSTSGLDVDLDGSYSAEHPAGLTLATLFGSADSGTDGIHIFEHSLACSDRERRRLLLSYDTKSGALRQVLLLVEGRRAAGETALPPCSAPPSTLFSLLGVWAGDACMRSLTRTDRGFGLAGGGGFSSTSNSKKRGDFKLMKPKRLKSMRA